MDQLYLPTIDHTEPTLEFIQKGVDYIHERTRKGDKAYIHCKGGHGRSGAIAIAWIYATQDVTLIEAQKILKSKHPYVRQTLYLQPNVKAFAEQYKRPAHLGKKNTT